MGADVTPGYLAGFLVPWPWSESYATDHALGSDYTEANPMTGTPTSSGSPRMRLEAVGTPESGVAQVYAQVTRGGAMGPGGAGVVYRDSTGDTWKGCEGYGIYTGYQSISTLTRRGVGAVVREDGTVIAVTTSEDGGTPNTVTLRAWTRSAAGAWSGTDVEGYLVSGALTEPAGADIITAPDGSLHAYARWSTDRGGTWSVACFRSTDAGVTWARQSSDVGISADNETRWLRFGVLGSGQVVAWVTYDTGTSTDCTQYVSTDGGHTFTSVATQARAAVWGVTRAGGQLVILLESYTASDRYRIARCGDGTASIFAGSLYDLRAAPGTAYVSGGGIVTTPTGEVWAYVCAAGSMVAYRSLDSGGTWTASEGYQTGASDSPAQVVAVHVRGEVLVIGAAWDSSVLTDGLMEWRFGGRSDVTLDVLTGFGGYDLAWSPLCTMATGGWAATDVGGTRTLSQSTGDRWVTGGGESISSSETLGVSPQTIVGRWVVRPITGKTTLRLRVDYSSVQYGIGIDLETTYIEAYDQTVGPVSPTAFGASTYVEIVACIAHDTAKAAVWYRRQDESGERVWSQLLVTGLVDTGGTGTNHSVAIGASSECYVRECGIGPASGSQIADGVTRPGDLVPVRLSAYAPMYLTGGVSVVARGGVAAVDGSTYTIPVTSLFRKDAMLPTVQPSPARPWRSGGVTTQDLRFTLDPSTAGAVNVGSDVWGLYLDRLVGVSQVAIYSGTGAGTLIATADLRIALTYAQSGSAVIPSASGSVTEGRWVARDELAGGYFECANGEVRRIASNTSGTLTKGSTVAENRATLYLDDIDGTEDSGGAGYIHPPRALIYWYLRGSRSLTQVRLRIASTVAAPPEGYREIGVLAMGPVHVLGRAWDRAEAVEHDPGGDIATLPDGSRTVAYRVPVRRRVEVAIVESWVATFDVLGATPQPDYVRASLHASSTPTSDAWGGALDLAGLAHEVRRNPVVYLPNIPVDSGSGDAVVVHTRRSGHGAVYGRITGNVRHEQVEAGSTITDDIHRVARVAMEEEV